MTYSSVSKYGLIGTETSWATGGTADKGLGLLVQDISNPLDREVIETGSISTPEIQKITTGIVDPKVSMNGDFQHGKILEYIFGSVSHAETTSDWKHSFTFSTTTTSAAIETGNNLSTDTTLLTTGCIVESAEVTIELNSNLSVSVDFVGKTVTSGSSASSAILSSLPVFPHALVDIQIDGVSATEVQNATITFNFIVERSGGIKSNLYQQGHRIQASVEFSANLGFADNTYQELFLGGSGGASSPSATADPTSFEFLLHATNGVALGSGQRALYLELENCQSPSFNETTSVGGLTFIDLTGKGTLKECYSVDNISDVNW